jgi:hypothetical protein
MSASTLPARQVHLDFHTSDHIADVGARFAKKQWQQGLRLEAAAMIACGTVAVTVPRVQSHQVVVFDY